MDDRLYNGSFVCKIVAVFARASPILIYLHFICGEREAFTSSLYPNRTYMLYYIIYISKSAVIFNYLYVIKVWCNCVAVVFKY